MSGEHGDGLQRSYLNERLFGKNIYSAMKELKSIFDPDNIFNPGKVVDAPLPTENLRFGEYRPLVIKTFLDWSSDNGFSGAVEMCSGQGVCRKVDDGIMCPSYMATRNERDTTRARANSLRALVSGKLPKDSATSKEMYDVFDLCLSCKACKSECPSGVDAAKMKLEFLGQYHTKHGFTLRDKMFGHIHDMSRLRSIVKPISNFIEGISVTRYLLSQIGITSQRSQPRLSNESFINWFNNRPQPANINKVVYFHDTWVSYYHPDIGKAAVELLEAAGFEVLLVENRVCCGRPMLSKGMIEQARHLALKNVAALEPYVNEGIPVIGTEPSCILTFRDEYLDLLPGNSQAEALSKNSYLLDEFLFNLQQSNDLGIDWKDSGPEVFYHGHCHQRSLIGNSSAMELLSLSGCGVTESNAGCCGMAGSFGYEIEHFDISRRIAEDRLIPAVNNSSQKTVIAVSGVSCHHQIEDFTERKVKHIARVLADQMR
jgi:Fe-S oxidoreductase